MKTKRMDHFEEFFFSFLFFMAVSPFRAPLRAEQLGLRWRLRYG